MATPKIEIVFTEPTHIRALAMNLRPNDELEFERLGVTGKQGLWRSYRNSIMRRTALVDNEVAAMWGVGGEVLAETGQPWLATSPLVYKISPLRFARIYKSQVVEMLNLFPRLANFVDASYTESVRLLELIGFTLGEPKPMGPHGAPFREFSMGR